MPFTLQATTERFQVNGLGGADSLTSVDGVGARTLLSVDGGAGDDVINGSDGPELIVGGEGNDILDGGGGRDDVEVNGSPTAGDVFTIQPNGTRIKFDRSNLVPFSLDIGSSETMDANGLGGDDAITVGDVGSYSVTAAGGSGNDTLTGGSGSETFLGGSGNDTINPGGGVDVVSGDDRDDRGTCGTTQPT